MITFRLPSVVKHDVKCPRHCNDKLMEVFVGMPASLRTARHVVKVIGALDVEWNMIAALDKSEISSRIGDLRKIYYAASIETEWIHN